MRTHPQLNVDEHTARLDAELNQLRHALKYVSVTYDHGGYSYVVDGLPDMYACTVRRERDEYVLTFTDVRSCDVQTWTFETCIDALIELAHSGRCYGYRAMIGLRRRIEAGLMEQNRYLTQTGHDVVDMHYSFRELLDQR